MTVFSMARGTMTGPAEASSPRGGASSISRSSLALAMAEPCKVFSRSAPALDVDRPRAMSDVTWSPPTFRLSICSSDRPPQTAALVEPPPMSMQTAPRSISSSSSAARDETTGAAATPCRSRCASSRQWLSVVKTFSAMETTSRSSPSEPPRIERGSWTPRAPSTDQAMGRTWIGRRLGRRI
jgi:hypothetical protein